MAGHSKFKNIQHRKNAQDTRKSKIFTKIIKEITIAAKDGINPQYNAKLRMALSNAHAANINKARIDKAIQGSKNKENGALMLYEGFAMGGIGVMVEALKLNKNRTVSWVRSAFSKYGGSLGESGSVAFMFNRLGVIRYTEQVEEIATYAMSMDVQDIDICHDSCIIYTTVQAYKAVLEQLLSKYCIQPTADIQWVPHKRIHINDAQYSQKLQKLMDVLKSSQDVKNVYTNATL